LRRSGTDNRVKDFGDQFHQEDAGGSILRWRLHPTKNKRIATEHFDVFVLLRRQMLDITILDRVALFTKLTKCGLFIGRSTG
jgi:hypothetical protein